MIILDNLGEFRKGRLWINTPPSLQYKSTGTIQANIESNNDIKVNFSSITLELLLMPRHASNYALLGAKFIPTNEQTLQIEVNISQYDGEVITDTIAMSEDEVHVGIPEEYANSIMQTAISTIKEVGGLSAGILQFNLGAHGYVGSSILVFSKITSVIIKLLTEKVNIDSVDKLKELAAQQIKLV